MEGVNLRHISFEAYEIDCVIHYLEVETLRDRHQLLFLLFVSYSIYFILLTHSMISKFLGNAESTLVFLELGPKVSDYEIDGCGVVAVEWHYDI